jgi:hypothetical protein
MITPTKKEIIPFMESLVMNRFSLPQLNEKLSQFFGENLEVHNVSQDRIDNGEDDELADWNLMVNVLREGVYELFLDIYILPTREFDNENNVRYYVTEVGYDFC